MHFNARTTIIAAAAYALGEIVVTLTTNRRFSKMFATGQLFNAEQVADIKAHNYLMGSVDALNDQSLVAMNHRRFEEGTHPAQNR